MSKKRYAFFDVDETIINVKSMFSFQDYYFQVLFGVGRGQILFSESLATIKKMVDEGLPRELVNSFYYTQFKGHSHEKLKKIALEWYAQIKTEKFFFILPIVDRLRKHQRDGVLPVFVSGSSVDILFPLARDLNVCYVLANKPSSQDGVLDGLLLSPQTIGQGKATAILNFLRQTQCKPENCFGYGDHISDLPMLEIIGSPYVVAGNAELCLEAKKRNWPIIER